MPPQSLTVRRYDPADADAVARLNELALRASPVEFVPDAPADEPLEDVSGEYLDTDGEFLVGVVEGAVVAMGGFRPRGADAVELEFLRVHPDHQRRGYGGELVAALGRRASAAGATRSILVTNERLTAARRLYEARGYEETGRETDADTGHTFVHYRKRLDGV